MTSGSSMQASAPLLDQSSQCADCPCHASPGLPAHGKLLLGANTPWKRVRWTLGFGTRAASRAIKSSGSKMTCVVPSR